MEGLSKKQRLRIARNQKRAREAVRSKDEGGTLKRGVFDYMGKNPPLFR